MSTAARIDELRKKFDENPRRYFAPLANELRKAGDLTQAIALCREHLPKQPGHMSGYIVFGQALYESGALPEARTVFEQALALDPENLIALRHLGDIAKAAGENSAARRWYERVLDADPRNEEITAQLATLSTGLTPAMGVAASAFLSSPPAPAPVPVETRAVVPTPIAPMMPLGLGAVPTPDAALRAVDFDVVNRRMSRYTPLDLEAIEASGLPATPMAAPQPEAPESREPSDIEHNAAFDDSHAHAVAEEPLVDSAMDIAPTALNSLDDALSAFAANDPSSALQDDEFGMLAAKSADAPRTDSWFADSAPAAESAEEVVDEVAFEEGLIAPEWTDPSSLLPSVSTPRTVTPVAVNITPEAVAAFGREPHEPHPLEDVSDESDAVTSELPDELPDELPTVDAQQAALGIESQDDGLEATGTSDTELPWLAAPADVDDAAESARELEAISSAFSEDARTVGESDEVVVSTVELEPAIAPEASFADLLDSPIDSSEELIESVPLASFGEAFDPVAAPTPLDSPVFLVHDEHEEASELLPAGLHESTSDVPSESHEPIWLAEDALPYADESDVASDDDEATQDEEASADSPAFVTETMAELLVSQGFIARAATVYEELVRRHPYDPVLTSRLAELNAQLIEEAQAAEPVAEAVAVPSVEAPQEVVAELTTEGEIDETDEADHETTHEPEAFESFAPVETSFGYVTPAYSSPAYPTPAFPTPAYSTPAYATPVYATPAFGAGAAGAAVITARERFARLAARRVPRRTPAQAAPAIEEQGTGLAVLFGDRVASSDDDAAARALADAFAPITEADEASDGLLDFSIPDIAASEGAPQTFDAPALVSLKDNASIDAAAAGNAGFSFDRFFPDPASQPAPGAAPTPTEDPAAPVSDDLAQFSAWLKGLGST